MGGGRGGAGNPTPKCICHLSMSPRQHKIESIAGSVILREYVKFCRGPDPALVELRGKKSMSGSEAIFVDLVISVV